MRFFEDRNFSIFLRFTLSLSVYDMGETQTLYWGINWQNLVGLAMLILYNMLQFFSRAYRPLQVSVKLCGYGLVDWQLQYAVTIQDCSQDQLEEASDVI